jgi:hypothetical protein
MSLAAIARVGALLAWLASYLLLLVGPCAFPAAGDVTVGDPPPPRVGRLTGLPGVAGISAGSGTRPSIRRGDVSSQACLSSQACQAGAASGGIQSHPHRPAGTRPLGFPRVGPTRGAPDPSRDRGVVPSLTWSVVPRAISTTGRPVVSHSRSRKSNVVAERLADVVAAVRPSLHSDRLS